MNAQQAAVLNQLMHGQRVASLGTLHDQEPFVSMVPFAVLPETQGFVIHVSRLAAHTGDMLAHPNVSLLIMATLDASQEALALPRATFQSNALYLDPQDAVHAAAKQAYLARLPEAEPLFQFADFSLFLIKPYSVRLIGGFAQATTITGEAVAELFAATE